MSDQNQAADGPWDGTDAPKPDPDRAYRDHNGKIWVFSAGKLYLSGWANAVEPLELEKMTALVDSQHYMSTACHHGLHDQCRHICKFCDESCGCKCHALTPVTALAPEDDAPYEQADQELADIERRVAADRAVIDAAKVRAQVLRDLATYGSGSDGWDERDRESDRALLAAVDELTSRPAPTNSQTWEHPERHCHRCGGPNAPWSAPSPLWNEVMRGGDINADTELHDGIVCPTCFAVLAEDAGIAELWRLDATRVHRTLQTVTPSGRVWNEQTWKFEHRLAAEDPEPCKRCRGTGAIPVLALGGKRSGEISEEACPNCSGAVDPLGPASGTKKVDHG